MAMDRHHLCKIVETIASSMSAHKAVCDDADCALEKHKPWTEYCLKEIAVCVGFLIKLREL